MSQLRKGDRGDQGVLGCPGVTQIKVARLRDLALVSIDDAESPPFDETERICSAAKAVESGGSGWPGEWWEPLKMG